MKVRSYMTVPVALFVSACSDLLTDHSAKPSDAALASAESCALGVETALVGTFIQELVTAVNRLESDGALNAGQARALRNHLANVEHHVQAARFCPALAQLDAFREQVANFRSGGVLTDRQAGPLLERSRLLSTPPDAGIGTTEEFAPGVKGELRRGIFDGEEFTYEVIDGLAIIQGDMILGYADEFERWLADQSAAGARGGFTPQAGVCRFNHFNCESWTDGVIGYDFANDWGGSATNLSMTRRIGDAMRHWEENTGIRFERRASGERLVFRNSTGCSSWVGRKVFTGTDPQWINLSVGCGYATIIHEIAHAVGVFHEQSRSDRDDFVRINWDLIEPGREHNFEQYGTGGRDIGPYDFRSVMHYGCGSFRREGMTGNTIEPVDPAVSCGDIRAAPDMTDGDILGTYRLYPTSFTIAGAMPDEVRDRFTLGLVFSRSPVQRGDFIQWSSDRVPGVVFNGTTLATADVGLPPGEHTVTARITILGQTLGTQSIRIRLENEPPVVNLGPDRDVDLNRTFSVVADVSDAEDGSCPADVCSVTWDPVPEQDLGRRAVYRFRSLGPRTISLTVRDGAGGETTGTMVATVVNTPPVPVIVGPAAGSTLVGDRADVVGRATDINEGPDPGPGLLACGRLQWSSTGPGDTFLPSPNGCTRTLEIGGPGSRTIRLTATDNEGASAFTEVVVNVVACGENCPPSASFVIETPPNLQGEFYTPPFTEPGYGLDTPLHITGSIADSDAPPDNPVAYEWRLLRPCFDFTGVSCPPFTVLGSGSLNVPDGAAATTVLNWTPATSVAAWDGCFSTALPHTIQLWVRDSRGATNIVSRTIYLACLLG